MKSPFSKSFDELLNDLLTDYQNQTYIDENGKQQQVDVSKGSLNFIKAACFASALWGLHQGLDWGADQIFPDTADDPNLYHHGAVDGIAPLPNESPEAYLVRVQDFERKPLAGGNRYDYVKWAKEVAGIANAWCYPAARGNGTVDIVCLADVSTGSEIPSGGLLTAVKTYIDDLRPVGRGADAISAIAPTVTATNVTMSNIGAADPAILAAEVTAYMNGFIPDQKLYVAQLKALAINLGAENPTVTAPGGDVTPAAYYMVRPGVINVSA